MAVDWNEKNLATLKRMWGAGCTASTIAREIPEATRSAILGKARRLGLDGRPSPIKADPEETEARRRDKRLRLTPEERKERTNKRQAEYRKRQRGPQSMDRMGERAPVRRMREEPVDPGLYIPKPRVSAAKRPCKWPIGDPRKPGFHFCEEESEPNRVYYAQHWHDAHQPGTNANAGNMEKMSAAVLPHQRFMGKEE